MKKLSILLFAVAVSTALNAQNVNIPDGSFENGTFACTYGGVIPALRRLCRIYKLLRRVRLCKKPEA